MNKTATFASIAGTLLCLYLPASPAQAQSRTWVSGVGDDVNPCSRTAPCKTFAGAISKTAANGEINCLDPGGFGAVTITKSIIIDCHEIFGSVLVSGTNGISILSDNAAALNVRLRNINFTGLGSGLAGVLIQGATTGNTSVIIEDCRMDGFTQGVRDARTGAGELYIRNTTSQNNSGAAFTVNGSSGVKASFDNVRAYNSSFGIAIGTAVTAMISNSVMSGNTNGGLETEGTSQVSIDNSQVSSNGIGFQVLGGTVRVSNSNVAFNTALASGTINSFTNNRFSGNGAGGTITAIGGPTSASGQQ
jgi:Right handed beta helix region